MNQNNFCKNRPVGHMLSVFSLMLCMLFAHPLELEAQELGYGFRAGLSFSKLTGPLEMGPDGAELESYDYGTGFHIGINTALKFTDLVGIRGEFMFSQRGTKYAYDGPSYYLAGLHGPKTLLLRGNRKMSLTVTNAYIDIPITAYYKLGALEISGGIGAGLNVASSAGGRITFNGQSDLTNQPVDEFDVTLSYNYRSNRARQVENSAIPVLIDGQSIPVPDRVGAYYWFAEKDKSQFKPVDFYLVGGLSYFINEGLFLGGRLFYGLSDIDRNDYDISHQTYNNGYTFREDDNKNITIQVSIGFSF